MKPLLFFSVAALSVTLLLLNRPNSASSHPPQLVDVQPTAHFDTAGRIPIDAKRWYQVVNASSGLEGLFDGVTEENVNTGWSKLLDNYDAYYPLRTGEQMTIDRIRLYDYADQNLDKPMTLSIITADWKRIPIARFVGDKYKEWVGPDPRQPGTFRLKTPVTGARFLLINTSGAYPSEIELYGSYTPGNRPTLPIQVRHTPFRQAVGVNMFEWNMEEAARSWEVDENRIPALRSFAAVRHYMDWEKLEAQPGQYSYNLTLSGAWNYDAMYERLKAEHVDVLACLKTIPKWLENLYPADQRDYGNNPVRYGADLSKPASYIEQARVAFQYMARYGYNKRIDPALVSVTAQHNSWAPANQKKIGMGLIRYIECENERDKTWKGRQGYQTAREYAANLSAFYDGHKNTLGPATGVKNADPTVTVVIGGLAAHTTDYVRAMVDWCREFRGYHPDGRVNLCWDVINQHLYANDVGTSQLGSGKAASRGAAPELAGVGEQAVAFVRLSHELCNDMPVWITEAGYDTNPGSPFHAIAIGSKSVEQTQADWTLRTALLYLRKGIDRVFFYQMYDENPADPTQFSSMGLINGNKTRKPAADYLYQATRLIGSFTYQETLRQTSPAQPIVDRYEQSLPGGKRQTAYVLVVPDERGRTATYTLPVSEGDTVQLFVPTKGQESMTKRMLVSLNGSVQIPVSETPVFALLPAERSRK
ncbi:hypothetical protein [Fibrella forsythiae]|uniref:Uncharacterized protein n=1 Tax=Fibrella forsythiae TaxID=2817061 RepID=A0ABS3JJU5_9BACT|nr:hypothetical protein [Fibrella forsythiae]MBO0950262.1 hypothetical protein [Fibrella forsythiae]